MDDPSNCPLTETFRFFVGTCSIGDAPDKVFVQTELMSVSAVRAKLSIPTPTLSVFENEAYCCVLEEQRRVI